MHCKVEIIFHLCALTFIYILQVLAKNDDWNYLVFAQQWAPAVCLELEHEKCSIPEDVADWTVHGLWPSSNSDYPSFCNSSWPFKLQNIQPIIQELRIKWPNLFAGQPESTFWKHEWSKHGTCAASLDALRGELKYFQSGVKFHDEFNIYEVLRKATIVPNEQQPYVLKYLENIFEMQLKKHVKIECKMHKSYPFPLLTSIYICLDKKFQPIDCKEEHIPSCNQSFVTYLPFSRNRCF